MEILEVPPRDSEEVGVQVLGSVLRLDAHLNEHVIVLVV